MAETHGEARVQRVTASVARTVMSGSQQAWETLSRRLWADDGSQFDAPSQSGPCAFGHEHEEYARGKFWTRHPNLTQEPVKFVKFKRPGFRKDHVYSRMLGVSPDMVLSWNHLEKPQLAGGGEIKSPTTEATFRTYVAHMARGHLPPEHEDQVRFSLFVTGWPTWWFVTHFGEDNDDNYRELLVPRASLAQDAWENRFRPRLNAFLKFHMEGEPPKRDKLGGGDLAKLLG